MISRFYEQFSRSSRILGHFGSSKKFQTLRTQIYHISFWSGWSGDSKYIICFAKNSIFAVLRKHLRISRNTILLYLRQKLLIKSRNQNIFPIFGLSDKFPFRRYIICWGNLSHSKNYWWGGAPRTVVASFYSAKLCKCLVPWILTNKFFIILSV